MRETLQADPGGALGANARRRKRDSGQFPRITFRHALVACVTAALNFSLTLDAQTRTIGSVSDIDEHGNWYIYPDANSTQARKLAQWHELPAGGVIRSKSPKAGDYIAIVDVNLKPLVAKRCESASSCSEPIYLPREPKEAPNEMSALYRKVLEHLSAEPYEPSMHRTRASGTRFDEGVVPLVNSRLDLQTVMQHMPPGKYSLAPFAAHATPQAKASGAVAFDRASGPTVVSVGNRKPGLYEISLVQAADPDSPIVAASVRILVCSSKDHPDLEASFRRAEALTQQWERTASSGAHAFLRAYLAELAESRQISGKP